MGCQLGWNWSWHSFIPLAIPAHKTHCWALTWKTCNWECAYAVGFPVLAEGLDMLILRNSATNGKCPFGGKELCWMNVWCLIPQQFNCADWRPLLPAGWGERFWLRASVIGRVVRVMPHLLIIPWHFALQQREIKKNISQGTSKVFNICQSYHVSSLTPHRCMRNTVCCLHRNSLQTMNLSVWNVEENLIGIN